MTLYHSPFGDIPLRDQTITERVFEGLAAVPDKAVMIEGPTGRRVLAKDLMDGIRRLAGGLTARGLAPGKTIAIMAPNIPEYALVFHAIAFAGGTITTLNPTYTEPEIRHQLIDAGAEFLITVPPLLDLARAAIAGTQVTEIAVIGEAPGATSLSALMGAPLDWQAKVDLDRHVLVIPYSSGTTGLPKGVMLSHRNLVVNTDQLLATGAVQPDDVTPAFLPFFHIYGMLVLVNAHLAQGACVVTMPRFDLELFLRIVQDHKARTLYIVPPVALALAKNPLVDQFDLGSLRMIFSGAAPLGVDLANAVARRLNCAMIQGYGMTEMSPVSHANTVAEWRPGSAGRTVAGTSCRIVDPVSGADLDVGKEGELWVKGPQVMLGYLNRPDATAQTLDAEGWLRTGDIGYFDVDGYLFIIDRLKELIKVKGFQVAPAEVEAVLLSHPRVSDAAVIGLPDDESGEVPIAFVVSAPGEPPTIEELQQHIAAQLAPYKQVHRIDFVTAIPKSASGKILRRVLRAGLAG